MATQDAMSGRPSTHCARGSLGADVRLPSKYAQVKRNWLVKFDIVRFDRGNGYV